MNNPLSRLCGCSCWEIAEFDESVTVSTPCGLQVHLLHQLSLITLPACAAKHSKYTRS